MHKKGNRVVIAATALTSVAIVAVVLLGGCSSDAGKIREANATAAASEGSRVNEDGDQGVISILDVREGDCFNGISIPEVGTVDFEEIELVPCSGEWDYRAVSSFTISGHTNWPGEEFMGEEADRRCGRVASIFFFPSQQSWDLGDRVINCVQEGR